MIKQPLKLNGMLFLYISWEIWETWSTKGGWRQCHNEYQGKQKEIDTTSSAF